MKTTAKVVALVAAILGTGEAAHLVASRLDYPGRATTGPLSVLVLGFGSRNRPLREWANGWRARIAVRSVPAEEFARTRFVVSGWSFGHSEAAILADRLRELGVADEQIVLEEHARTTRQNLRFGIRLAHPSGPLMIASNPLHAARARHYLQQMDPVSAARLSPTADYRVGEYLIFRPALAIYEIYGAAGAAIRPWLRSWRSRSGSRTR